MSTAIFPTVLKYLEISGQVTELSKLKNQLRDEIVAALPNGSYRRGQVSFTVRHTHAWSQKLKDKFESAYPASEYPELYKTVLDTSKASKLVEDLGLTGYETSRMIGSNFSGRGKNFS